MSHKEFYRRNLPHLQIPGQIFFVTWLLEGIFNTENRAGNKPLNHHRRFTSRSSGTEPDGPLKTGLTKEFKTFDDGLDHLKPGKYILTNPVIAEIIAHSVKYWNNIRIDLITYCIMSNHVHAVFSVYEKDESGKPLYLQDIMKSIKNFSARKCNKILNRVGQFWHRESYDRLIRDREELYFTVNYVLDNPVKAGFCKKRSDWEWTYLKLEYFYLMEA